MQRRPRGASGDPTRARRLERFLELRPLVLAELELAVPDELRCERTTVTRHQLRALSALSRGNLTMRELASVMGVMRPTATVLADRLVAHALVVRVPDERDRRVVRPVPTERGRALARRFRHSERRAAAMVFDRLSDAQGAALVDVMETLAGRGDGRHAEDGAGAG